jgi:3-deoxy-7-phosphoheptulonate synthase
MIIETSDPEHLRRQLQAQSAKFQEVTHEELTYFVCSGKICDGKIEGLSGYRRAQHVHAAYPLVSREWKASDSVVRVAGVPIGAGSFVTMAGPCSVESESQLMACAEAVAASGAQLLRGGAFKPRTSPYEFQGHGEEALRLLALARERFGLGIVTEVMAVEDVALVAAYADLLQVGARNMQNYALLKALGKSGRPVLLKRGLSATYKELLMAAEYVVAHGNPEVILCERGIRTFESHTRNTCDIAAIPALRELTHLPLILDPSHATGRRSLIAPLAKAAVAVGADGLLVECHPDPDRAWSDGAQSLNLDDFQAMMRSLEPYVALRALEREAAAELEGARTA